MSFMESRSDVVRILDRKALPFPPTVNTYWKHARGRHYLSDQALTFRAQVVHLLRHSITYLGRLALRIDVYPPDLRSRDLDNLPKGVQDALAHAGVIKDDSQIDVLEVVRHPKSSDPRVEVTLIQLP